MNERVGQGVERCKRKEAGWMREMEGGDETHGGRTDVACLLAQRTTCLPACPPVFLPTCAFLQMAVVALQPLLSRETDPVEGGVLTVSRFNTGRWDMQRLLLRLWCV